MFAPTKLTMPNLARGNGGFTLVELIIVIVLTGIVAGCLVVFLIPTFQSYVTSNYRAAMTDMADTALKRMARDIRSAVPNSIQSPSSSCFELVPSTTGGRYRLAADTTNALSAPIDGTQAVTQFDVLSPMSVTPSANDWVVIDNQNTTDVYNGVNATQIASATTALPTASPPLGVSRITLNNAFMFPASYSGGRFSIVSNNQQALFYVCSNVSTDANGNGLGSLYRVNALFSTSASSCPSVLGADLLASNVSACTFVYNPNQGATQQSGFVWMQLSLGQNGESVTLSYGAHVDNVP